MHALWILSGIAVWAVHFMLLYGLTALACARGYAHMVPWIIGVTALAAATLSAGIMVKGYRGRASFVGWMTFSVVGFALIAIIYETTAGWLSPLCV